MRQEPHAGAPVVHGSELPEFNPKTPEPQLHPVDVFAAWAGEEERALRIRIHRARDVAQARAARSKHGRARAAYRIAAELASDWVFARSPLDDLEVILATLARMFLVAGAFERLEAPDA